MTGQARRDQGPVIDRSALFDETAVDEEPDDVDFRHHHAAQLCATCPVLDRCSEWSEGTKLHMVTAGRTPAKSGRPRRAVEP
ncbi:transcriptional regulator [Gordonia sp. VNK1]|uniref:transcriptional regulator n=1 Tax=Gordonia oleivorans TaxID=3156618 RepID=UPI0032B41FB6